MAGIKVITFTVGGRQFALPTKNVKEILRTDRYLKPLFYNQSGVLKGVMELEGQMVSVLNTPFILGIQGNGSEPIILVCREKGLDRAVGLVVSTVDGIRTVDPSLIKEPQNLKGDFWAGVFEGPEGRKVLLIELGRFLMAALQKIKGG